MEAANMGDSSRRLRRRAMAGFPWPVYEEVNSSIRRSPCWPVNSDIVSMTLAAYAFVSRSLLLIVSPSLSSIPDPGPPGPVPVLLLQPRTPEGQVRGSARSRCTTSGPPPRGELSEIDPGGEGADRTLGLDRDHPGILQRVSQPVVFAVVLDPELIPVTHPQRGAEVDACGGEQFPVLGVQLHRRGPVDVGRPHHGDVAPGRPEEVQVVDRVVHASPSVPGTYWEPSSTSHSNAWWSRPCSAYRSCSCSLSISRSFVRVVKL